MEVELNNLTETERDAIMNVLRRDEDLRNREMDRVRKLRTDVKRIRMKGVIKAGHNSLNTCARCREPFGWLFNKGSLCPKCQHKVCDKCKQYAKKSTNNWLCILCFKQKELDAQTNKWFYSQFRRSKRNKKTNNVVTGPDIVRSSIRRAHREAASGSGSDGGRNSLGDEIKRVLSNNNTSPKSRRAGAQEDQGESSDTQSMGTGSSPRQHKHPSRNISDITYPKDSDQQLLFDLMGPRAKSEPDRGQKLQVKRVVNRQYSDSGSSTSDSEPDSPNASTKTESTFGCDSIRSSLRSSSAVSSDGRMTIVTESCISDIDTISIMSELPQETPVMIPYAQTGTVTSLNQTSHNGKGKQQAANNTSPLSASNTFKSSDSVIDHPSHSSQILNSSSTLDEYEPVETVVMHRVTSNRRRESMSSDSDDDYTTEQITKVKFRRLSKKGQRSRSPSPESQGHHRKSSTTKSSNEEAVGGQGCRETGAAGAAAGGKEQCARDATVGQAPDTPGATAGITNISSSSSNVHRAAPKQSSRNASCANSVALPSGTGEAEDFSSDGSDYDLSSTGNGWQDDDPIRLKVGALLKKYGTMESLQTNEEKEARVERKYESHNILKDPLAPPKSSENSQHVSFVPDEYVIIDTMDVHDTSTETSVEPQSGSEGAHSISDINDDSFDDLEWDGDTMLINMQTTHHREMEGEDNAELMTELRAAVAASLASVDTDVIEGKKSPSLTAPSASLQDEDNKPIEYQFQSYADNDTFSRIGRYPRMFPIQDDECSDSLSIITEMTEPDESGRYSSLSTPVERSRSRSSTPVQRPRSSTPSTIEELDTEDEILSRPSDTKTSKMASNSEKYLKSHLKTVKSGLGNTEVDSSSSPRPESTESDRSFSQVSECSGTESAQESHVQDVYHSQKLALGERRDSFDVLAESSLLVSSNVNFADVYETNKKLVDVAEVEFDEYVALNNTTSPKQKMLKPPRKKIQGNDNNTNTKVQSSGIGKNQLANKVKGTKDDNAKYRPKGVSDSVRENPSLNVRSTTNRKSTFEESEDLADSYKEIRKNLSHVKRNDEPDVKGKRRKMSDGLVVDSSHVASIDKLTKMFDVAPAYMRSASPRLSSSGKEAESDGHEDDGIMDTEEEERLDPNVSVVPFDDEYIVMSRRRNNRESFVMDAGDAGPINISDLSSQNFLQDISEIDNTHLDTFSCPSHNSFNEGLRSKKDSQSLTSSQKYSNENPYSSPRKPRVRIQINESDTEESSTDELLNRTAIDCKAQGGTNVIDGVIPDDSGVEDVSRNRSASDDRTKLEASSLYYSASSETPHQETHLRRLRDNHDENINYSKLLEANEASILDESFGEADVSRDSLDDMIEEYSGRYKSIVQYNQQEDMVTRYGGSVNDVYYTNKYDKGMGNEYNAGSSARLHLQHGLETLSECDSETTHDNQASENASRTSWASSQGSVDTSEDLNAVKSKVKFIRDSRVENDRSWSETGSEESANSNTSRHSDNGFTSSDWDHSRSENRKSCVSFDSLDVYLDCESDTAEERMHPERLEEDFALSLDLGPRLDPNLNHSNTPLKRHLREAHHQSNQDLGFKTHLPGAKHSPVSISASLHATAVTNPTSIVCPEHTTALSHTTDLKTVPKPSTSVESGNNTNFTEHTDKQSAGAVKVVQKQIEPPPPITNEKQHLLNEKTPSKHQQSENGGTEIPGEKAKETTYEATDSPTHTIDTRSESEVPSIKKNQSSTVSPEEGQFNDNRSTTGTAVEQKLAPPSEHRDDVSNAETVSLRSVKSSVTSSPVHRRDNDGTSTPTLLEISQTGDNFDEEIRIDDDDLENIDDVVASHQHMSKPNRSSNAPMHRSTGNLLSSISASKESIASYYSDAGEGNYGNVAISGEVLFGLDFNYKSDTLEISVKQCRDLAAVDKKKNRSDPYVKTYLLPDKTKSGKRKTRAKKHTLSPTYDELLKYQITKSELETRTLWLSVWNNDTFGRNDFLGEVTIPLDYYAFDDPTPQWYKLQDRGSSSRVRRSVLDLKKSPQISLKGSSPSGNLQKQKSKSVSFLDIDSTHNTSSLHDMSGNRGPFSSEPKSLNVSTMDLSVSNTSSMALMTYKGDLIVLLKYVTSENASGKKMKGGAKSRGELHALIKEARNLTAVRSNGTSDPFCKGYLLPEKTRGTKQKTPVMKRNVNPQWNHTFVFEDISLDDLRERSLELTIWDHDRFSSNDFLGGVRLNLGTGQCGGKEVDWMDSGGEEISIWQNMLDRPNNWAEASLMLRHTMAKRI